MGLLLLALALAEDPPPAAPSASPPETVDETVVIWADPAVAKARDALNLALREEGYVRTERREDRTIFKSSSPWKPRVILHDDGWIYLRREPPRVHSPGRSFADQGSPAAYLWCVIMPSACVSIGGWMVSEKKLNTIEGHLLEATRDEVQALNEAIARRALARRLNDEIPADLERIWGLPDPPEVRRRLLFEYWDSRTDTDAGAEARAAIEAFLRAVVQTSATPFTEAELAEFNRVKTTPEPFLPPRAPAATLEP